MQDSDNKTTAQLKDDLKTRTLRSSSPAIKRPASDMGGRDREEHSTDVEMEDQPDRGSSPLNNLTETPHRMQSAGKRQRNEESVNTSQASNPKLFVQNVDSEDSSTATESLLPSESAASTTGTSLMETTVPSTERPSVDEQVAKVKALIERTPHDKEQGYVVSYKWLRRVLARSSDPPQIPFEKSATEGEVGPVDNSDIAMLAEDTGSLKDEAGNTFTFLRPGLVLNEDFQILPQEAWDLVISWYGVARTSPVITRYAHSVNEENPLEVQYELYPPVFSFLKVPGNQTLQTQKDSEIIPPRMLSSRSTSFMEWLRDAKKLVHTNLGTKVRVWRVLGGIKSNSASGILTPIASRSASPAPGVEIVANAGNKMLLDVHTFYSLQDGEQRQLIEHKDHTADANYNGKVDLQTLGLGRDDVIVLEEQGPKPDEWPSESIKLSIKGSAKAKNLTASGRSSPSMGVMSRGRPQRDGRPKGIVGLTNLGNTCYMNSALQCIRSVEELTQYFLSGYYKRELNYDNPLGNHGEVAKAYGSFIDHVYQSNAAFAPAAFKRTIGKYGPSFAGYGQQDSQEFLAFLLDGLQEDLNRIIKKPYIEKPDSTDEMVHNDVALKAFADRNWNDYKARNDSVITDLFAGMYKSTLKCPVCDKVSIVFDPFSNLTLQLPIENNWSKEVVYFPLHKRPFRIDIDIDKNSTILDMKKFISHRTKYDPQKMICAESYKSKFYKIFDNNDVISESSMSSNEIVCVYELAEVPTNYNPDKKKKFSIYTYSSKSEDEKVDPSSTAADRLIVPVYHRVLKPNSLNRITRQFFGHPSYVVLSRADRTSYQSLLKNMLGIAATMTTIDIFEDDGALLQKEATPEDSDTLVVTDDGSSSSEWQNAEATSVQDDDGLVDVSMPDASQPLAEQSNTNGSGLHSVLRSGEAVPKKLTTLFELKVVHTDEGIPTGFNNIHDSQEYESVAEKARRLKNSIPHRPARSQNNNESDSSADELSDIPHTDSRQRDSDLGSESGMSTNQMSDTEPTELPEVSDLLSGKDSRGASKHSKKKAHARKGQKFAGRPSRRTPPILPQPRTGFETQELVLPGDGLILDWNEDAYEALFSGTEHEEDDMRGILTHRDLDLFPDEELAAKRVRRTRRSKNGVSLQDCLNEFGKTETLSEQNAWYCPRCKEHRRADKRFELWKVPDILIMHLKRFSSRNFRDKLELKVDYPVEGLDISDMVRDNSEGKSLIYDLIAVDNHYGGLGGGHYTAYAKNPISGNWYDYNDSHVSTVKDPEDVVQKAAYLLFYRRREDHPLGGPNLEKVFEAESDEDGGSREVSPSGEGQRLDGSSHNGLSSASAVQARRVGDGGLVNRNPVKMRDLTPDPEPGDHLRPLATEPDDPPPYDPMNWTKPTWHWSAQQPAAPPGSNVDESEDNPLQNFGHELNSPGNSSTGGAGGSPQALSDLEDSVMQGSDFDKNELPRENIAGLPQFQVTTPLDENDDDLPVQEIRPPGDESS